MTSSTSPLAGARILITGGTGSFGQAFARHAIRSGANTACIYSRGELAQANMRQGVEPEIEPRLRWFIGDVRDRQRLQDAMHGVDIVIHAAALKRVEVGEYNPFEMTRTNVEGAVNVIQAANYEQRLRSIERLKPSRIRVVALSTDKACAPMNTYGTTKLLAEKLFLSGGDYGTAMFAVTRYGNVAGSQGSVIPIWRAAIKAGQPIRITETHATRYWMTLQGACDLVEFTLSTMRGGEIVVPRLPAYAVGDLAKAIAGGTLRMNITGLGRGEKLHESMISQDEAPEFLAFNRHPTCIRPGLDRSWINTREHGTLDAYGLNSYHATRLDVADLTNRLQGIP